MGSCFSCFNCFNKSSIIKYVALKLPHGTKGLEYCEQTHNFIQCDINSWLSHLYINSEWTNWQIYNDETGHIISDSKHKKGHCKGIVAWNKKRISWLCHSVPNFPKFFDGKIISDIENSELIYGQSFQYIELEYSEPLIYNILRQLHIMEANIFSNQLDKVLHFPKINTIMTLQLSDSITHIAKSPDYHIDIYSEYLAKEYSHTWKVETWIRGHHILEESLLDVSLDSSNNKIIDITSLQFDTIKWSEKQDHSKWATTENDLYWIGDLNRMTSQYKRGGGGFICYDAKLASAFNKLIK